MAADGKDRTGGNVMEWLLQRVRQEYVSEHGEEPPEGFVEDARREIVLTAGKAKRDEHREIYEALAEE